jgi:hypothetical protein
MAFLNSIPYCTDTKIQQYLPAKYSCTRYFANDTIFFTLLHYILSFNLLYQLCIFFLSIHSIAPLKFPLKSRMHTQIFFLFFLSYQQIFISLSFNYFFSVMQIPPLSFPSATSINNISKFYARCYIIMCSSTISLQW